MQHLLLTGFIAAILAGLVSIILYAILRSQGLKKGINKSNAVLIALLALKLLIEYIIIYIWTNISVSLLITKMALYAVVSFLTFCIFCVTVLFLHNLLKVTAEKTRDIVIIWLAALAQLAIILPNIIIFINPSGYNPVNLDGVYQYFGAIACAYGIVISIMYFKNIRKDKIGYFILFFILNGLILGVVDLSNIKKIVFMGDKSILPYGNIFNLAAYYIWCGYSIYQSVIMIKKYSTNSVVLNLSADFIKSFHISGREKELIAKIIEGKNNREIGEELFISPQTVKNHIYNIFKKCGVKTRIELLHLMKNPHKN